MNQLRPNEVQISISDENRKGTYANTTAISHTPEEFILDFISLIGNSGSVVSRVVVSPSHAKRIMLALQENIAIYESHVGSIKAHVGESNSGGNTPPYPIV